MKKILIAILAILAAAVIFYFEKDKINIVNSDNGEQNEINLKENLQKVGKKIMKKADEKFDEAGQILKDEQKYHEQLKNEANRKVKIFEPIYKNGENSANQKAKSNEIQPNLADKKDENRAKSQNSQNKKKIEIQLQWKKRAFPEQCLNIIEKCLGNTV